MAASGNDAPNGEAKALLVVPRFLWVGVARTPRRMYRIQIGRHKLGLCKSPDRRSGWPLEGDAKGLIQQSRKVRAVLATRCTIIAALAASLALSACATSPSTADSPAASNAQAPDANAQRDLTPQEKKVIAEAVSPSLRDPGSAKYRWTKFPTVPPDNGMVNYCAVVDAKSPYAAYNGRQEYIVETKVVDGKVSAAVMGLIAGGKDAAIVANMCAKYGLDPNNAT